MGRVGEGHGRGGEGAGETERLGEPFPYANQFGRSARGCRGRQMAGGGQVHVVVEEFDDGDGAADARAGPERVAGTGPVRPAGPARACALDLALALALERLPGVEYGAAHRLPVEPVASA